MRTSLVASESDIYSASIEDCLCDIHETASFLSIITYHVIDFLLILSPLQPALRYLNLNIDRFGFAVGDCPVFNCLHIAEDMACCFEMCFSRILIELRKSRDDVGYAGPYEFSTG
jgi:hypothetical protein